MLPKEDCVLSIRFFFGGVLGGGLMVTMLPRGARRRGGGLGGSDVGSPRRLPGSLAARADRLHSTMIHEPSAATPRRAGGRSYVKFVVWGRRTRTRGRPATFAPSRSHASARSLPYVKHDRRPRRDGGLALAITRRVAREEGDLGLPVAA